MTAIKTNTGPGDAQWEAWTLERTRDLIEQTDPTRVTQQAFLIVVRDRIFQTGRLDDEKHCSNVIQRMIRTGELPLKLEIQNALNDAWSGSIYQRFEAGDRQVLEEALGSGLADIADSQSLLEIIRRLGQQHNWPLNTEGQQLLADQQRESRRAGWIQTITENGARAMFPLFAPRYGCFKWISAETLQSEPDEMLEQLAELVPKYRAQLSSNRKQQPTAHRDSLGEISNRPGRNYF